MASNQFDQRILELVNQERTAAGKNPLQLNNQLDQAANLHNDKMAQADNMSHNLPGEASLGDRISDTGYDWRRVGENIAVGQQTPEQVMDGWMNSPGHRKNILNSEFTDIGVGYGEDNTGPYWTQVFGKGDSSSAPANLPEPAPEQLDEVDEPQNDFQEQPVDEVENPEPTPEQPVDEIDEPKDNSEEQPVDEVDNPNSNPDSQPVEEGDNYDEMVLGLFNAERAAAGIDLLEINSQLDQSADLHTNEMVQADKLSHQLPGEASFADRVSETGYEWRGLGQNIAGGFKDPEALVDALMDNSNARANILNPKYTHLGSGYAEASDNITGDTDIYWTQVLGMDTSSVS